MSRIYFHTEHDTVAVSGRERASFGVFCSDVAWGFLRHHATWEPQALRRLFSPEHYVNEVENFAEAARCFLAVGSESLQFNGKRVDPFLINLNTALAIGNDAVKLAARIHGQCEIHCWIGGENRAWLSGIVQQGLRSGFYRQHNGWDDVATLLDTSNSGAVVLSYSVCERFPEGEKAWDDALEALIESDGGLELTPSNWYNFYFGNGYNAMQLSNDLAE